MSNRDDDDFGAFRPSRDVNAPTPSKRVSPTGRAEPLSSRTAGRQESGRHEPSLGYAPPPRTAPPAEPVSAKAQPSPEDFIVPPSPQSIAPSTAQSAPADDIALPRIARTGPARSQHAPSGLPPAPPPPRAVPRANIPERMTSAPRPVRDTLPDFDDDDEREGRSWLKIIGFTTVGLATLAGAAAVALLVYTPVDLVRDRLIREVKAKTGRDLVIGGKPSVSFWPNVAVALDKVTLSNPPGMAGPPMITMQRLDATIQLWPLLQKRVQVDQLVLQSPRITLTVDGQGRRNWDFAELLPAHLRPVQYAQAGKLNLEDLPEELRDFARGASSLKRASAATSDGLSLGRVRIIDGAVQHFDERTGQADEVTAINLTIDAPDLAGPLQAAGSVQWHGEAVRLDTRVMPAKALLSGAPVQTTAAMGSGPLQITYAGTIAAGAGAPRLEGQLTAKAPALSKAAQWLGQPVVGEAANGPLNFKGRISHNGTRSGFSEGSLQLPGLNLTGALAVESGGVRPKISGNVRLAEFNPDLVSKLRVLEPAARPVARAPAAVAPLKPTVGAPQSIEDLLKEPSAAKPQVRGYTRRDGWSEEPLDVAPLGLADAELKVAFNRLSSPEFNVGPGHVTVNLVNRVLKLTLDDVTLHDGKARGTIAFDGAAQRPSTAINVTLDGVALQPLLKDFGADGIDGKARVSLAVTGSGKTERQLIDALTGKAEILVPRGAVIGHDLSAAVRGLTQGRIPRFERDPNARTEFSDFGASFNIVKGVADNRDFRIVTRDVRAIGNGQIALGARTIDFIVRPKLTGNAQAPAGLGGPGLNLSNIDIPVRITGPLANPQVAADLGNILKDPSAVVDAVKNLDKGEVQETVKGILSGDDASKKKAKDFLNNLLKQ